MQVRVFESQDMASGLKLVRKELGPSALILSTRTVRHGKLGPLGNPTIQITAAIETPKANMLGSQPSCKAFKLKIKKRRRNIPAESSPQKTFHAAVESFAKADKTVDHSAMALLSHTNTGRGHTQSPVQTSQVTSNFDSITCNIGIQNEAEKHFLASQLLSDRQKREKKSRMLSIKAHWTVLTASIAHALCKRLNSIQPNLKPVTSLLEQYGIDEETSKTIAQFALVQLGPSGIEHNSTLHHFIARTIENLIKVKPPLFKQQLRTLKQSRIALIDPTGVGKTTTVAKLAAHYFSNYSPSIALIAIDTSPFATTEPLKVYAETMNLPVDVIISPEQIRESLRRYKDKDLVLIDTAGLNPRNTLGIHDANLIFPI